MHTDRKKCNQNKLNDTYGLYSLHVNKLAQKVFAEYSYVLLVHQAVHTLAEVYGWIHQIHTPNIYIVCHQPALGHNNVSYAKNYKWCIKNPFNEIREASINSLATYDKGLKGEGYKNITTLQVA